LPSSNEINVPSPVPSSGTPGSFTPPAGDGFNSQAMTTLQIRSSLQNGLEKNMSTVMLVAIAKRMIVLGYKCKTRVRLTLEDRTVTFSDDSMKILRISSGDHDYHFSGDGEVSVTLRSLQGQISTGTVRFTFSGEGSIKVNDTDAGTTIPLRIKVDRSRIVSNDTQSFQSEIEQTLSLGR
jgi:hypothetical protein